MASSSLYKELGYLARKRLAVVLDHESPRGADWKGLADKMGYSYEVVMALRGSHSPTMDLLEKWEKQPGGVATLENLMGLVESLGCVQGVTILREEQELRARTTSDGCPITPTGSLDPTALTQEEIQRIRDVSVAVDPQQLAQGIATIPTSGGHRVLEQQQDGYQGDLRQYDVFLSFAEADSEFAEEVRQRIIQESGAKVFVPSEGLLTDRNFHEEIADIIREGCLRTIVILSPDYISSPWCGYELNLSFIRSPDAQFNSLIPILYRECEVPGFLRHLRYQNYPKWAGDRDDCEEYFWRPLYRALAHRPQTRS